MLSKTEIEQQLKFPLESITLPIDSKKYEGKVRDCYTVGDKRILITSDRLSAFDVVLTSVPFKGQMLSQMAAYWFDLTKDIVHNHLIAQPHPNVMITQEVEILPVEIIVRGYLTGSAWRDYQSGNPISGITLPKGLKKSHRFETPLITPSTKAEKGSHDMPISSEEIVNSGLVDQAVWNKACEVALKLFDFGTKKASENGLILVDTKYEMGLLKKDGAVELILADEIHTPDSSRYWISSSYQQRYESGEDPEMLDKEFVRRWLIEQGYMGEGTPPEFTNEFRVQIAEKYMQVFEQITGKPFTAQVGPQEDAIANAIMTALEKI
jgi:phosphoribosylaminoimidazole-succinocarboxamide synthase